LKWNIAYVPLSLSLTHTHTHTHKQLPGLYWHVIVKNIQ